MKTRTDLNSHSHKGSSEQQLAFLALMEAHKGILFKVCRLYEDEEEDRQDLLQEILVQLWASYESFRGESQFSSWMYRVALNTAIVFMKSKKRHRGFVVAGPYPDLAEELRPVREQEEQLAIFHRAVRHLNKLEKATIFLYMEGRSGQEMAQILGVSHASVRVRITRVKEKLQNIIKTLGYEF